MATANIDNEALCPCGSGRPEQACCGPLVAGRQPAGTAEALMRSRYTAYVQRNAAYLYSSWHPDTRSARQDIAATPTVNWLDLSIVAVEAGGVNDQQGWVEFQARYRDNGVVQVLQERSCFLRHNGHWVYHSGEIKRAALPGVGRNAPCPCGSGKKFKRCCGR